MALRAFLVNVFAAKTSSPGQINFCTKHVRYISGIVEDYLGNPVARDIRLYRKEEYVIDTAGAKTPYAVTTSNATTGAYSFTVNANENTEWVVVCIGKGGEENILVFNNVRVSV